ncbi:hypothetical protein BST33_03545 [Mycolicibacter minnesotensis]|uniref:Uncharacterized protein n=2 Tax=Mycolicibacter minnesotensis TaxID=1118379 RepID=A0AA91M7I6_9MYCO|nr:hypothetical protein BST33_03545 [Mycolicibacter minnesotensis]
MNLELVKIPHRQGVQPFGSDHTGYSFTWFSGISDPDKYTNYRVMRDGVEVARLVTDETVYLEACGLGALSRDDDSDQFWGSGVGWQRFVNRDGKCRPA